MQCVTTVTFQIMINGSLSQKFHPTRGLRQGDPLSPYLFIICAESFSSLINRVANNGVWQGVQMGQNAPMVSYSFFVDDCFLFIKDTDHSAEVLLEVLG